MKKGRSTGAKALVKTLERLETEVIFGIPGGANLPIYEALGRSAIRRVLAKHEQGAAHMADGYARASGKLGVCLATSGPGATNLVTGIATAYMDSSPVMAITGQVPREMIGNDAFQEVDITGITIPITKHNYLVQHAEEIAPTLEEGAYLARTGRKGPVLIDIPRDVQTEEFSHQSEKRTPLEGYKPTVKGHPGQIKRAAGIIRDAKKPVIIAGGGLFLSGAFDSFAALVEATGIPVVHTLMGKSAYDNRAPLNLGLFGYHGSRVANTAVTEADVIIAMGTRFGDRSTGPLATFARGARIIHIDVDPAEIGKNVSAYLPIVGDVADILPRLHEILGKLENNFEKWSKRLLDIKHTGIEARRKADEAAENDSEAAPSTLLLLRAAAEIFSDPVLVTDVGRHQIYAALHYPVSAGRTFITSGGLGTMGFGLPAAIGAALGQTERQTVLVSGDGSFLMNLQELFTAAELGVNLTVLVMNDSRLGMIQQLQDAFYGARFDVSKFESSIRFDRLAETAGCRGLRITKRSEIREVLREAAGMKGPTIIDCVVGEESHVYPMVTGSNLMELTEGDLK
jgi:acetolactate synthase-1/2/3 large subunit